MAVVQQKALPPQPMLDSSIMDAAQQASILDQAAKLQKTQPTEQKAAAPKKAPEHHKKVVKAGKKQHKDAKKAVQPQAHQGLAQAKPAKKKALAKRKAGECAEEA